MKDELYYLLGLHQIGGIGDVLARKLLSHFGSARSVLEASAKDLKAIGGFDQYRINIIKKGFDPGPVEKEMKFIEQNDIRAYSIMSPGYPKMLKHIADAPFLLFSKGDLDLDHQRPIAIVGSRHNTPQGKQFTEELVQQLAPFDPCIISGLAYGIDIIAHKAAIEAGLSTIGVLAHGLDRIYPEAHRPVVKQMLNDGGILTEYRSGTNPDKQHFPMRNRIVAGMSEATIVIETAEKGGAMITAKLALSYDRSVFALPGRYNDPRSAGCNYLIKTNIAQLITSAEDIACFMNWLNEAQQNRNGIQQKIFEDFSEKERTLLDLVQEKEGIHIDELQIRSGFGNSDLATLLLQLEFGGAIATMPGKRYRVLNAGP